MKADLQPLFGSIPADADNLQIVGEFPRRIEVLSQATIWPGSGVVRRADGVVEEQSVWIQENLKHCGDFQSKWSWFPKSKRGTFFNPTLFWWPNYYHWHCDVLPRLLWAVPQLPAGTKIILPPALTSWQKRSLDLIGVAPEFFTPFEGRRPWKTERLVWASPLAMTGDHEPETLLAMRNLIRKKLGHETSKPGPRRIYLMRKNTVARAVVNEAELLPILESHGFEAVDCGRMDYDSQVKLFSEAGIVVGPHGAAFTNLLWAASGTRMLEIFEPGSVRRCYWSLCRALGHQHHCAVADASANGGAEANIKIDAASFALALAKICQKP